MNGLFIRYKYIIYVVILFIVFLLQDRELEANHNMLLAAGALVFLLGLPHGAADTLIFRKVLGLDGYLGWIAFLLVYILMAGSIYALWVWSQSLFLIYLLFVSIFHFGEDLYDLSHRWIKLSYGLAIVFTPALLWEGEVSKIYGFIVEAPMATFFAQLSNLFSWISLANLFISLFACRRNLSYNLYILIAWPIITLLILEPLLGFSLYFGLWHSCLHLKRLVDLKIMDREPMTIIMVVLPLLITLVGAYYVFQRLGGINDSSFSKIIFVGLGSLTFPHLFMVYALGSVHKKQGDLVE